MEILPEREHLLDLKNLKILSKREEGNIYLSSDSKYVIKERYNTMELEFRNGKLLNEINHLTYNLFLKTYDYFMNNDKHYLILEYIKCETLNDYLFDHGKVSNDELYIIIHEILMILIDLQSKNIHFTHYDLHAENILICKIDPTKRQYNLFGTEKEINSSYQLRFIDYGVCHISYKNTSEYRGWYEGNISTLMCGMTPSIFDPIYDLSMILSYYYKFKNQGLPEEIEEMFQANGFDSNLDDLVYMGRYDMPYDQKLLFRIDNKIVFTTTQRTVYGMDSINKFIKKYTKPNMKVTLGEKEMAILSVAMITYRERFMLAHNYYSTRDFYEKFNKNK